MTQHSQIGPSACSRWKGCPGSINATKDYPHETNKFAAEGTAAHEVGEKCLKSGKDADSWLKKIIDVEGMTFEVDREMANGVQLYLDVVRSDADAMGSKIHAEKRVDLTKVHPGIFGTADAILMNKKKLKVFDLKYGRGMVEAEGNEQALCYAIGALLLLDKKKQVEEIEMIIVQPRVPSPVKRWTVSRQYLNDFAVTLRAAAIATEDPDAPRIPGEKQCQWCQHKPHCPEVQQFALEKAMIDFQDDGDLDIPNPDKMGDNSVAEVMKWVPFVQSYLKAIEARALHMLEHGDTVDGFKLVEKVGRRAWMDEANAVEGLELLGLMDGEMFHTPAMLSPSQMEKLLDKSQRAEMNQLVEKKVSGVKMVPESNPSPAVGAGVASDFADD